MTRLLKRLIYQDPLSLRDVRVGNYYPIVALLEQPPLRLCFKLKRQLERLPSQPPGSGPADWDRIELLRQAGPKSRRVARDSELS